ncbi:hypothetical protein [Prevotella ihumii]|uniref:hypothetical protein n=1 Tax=Prevotella ihumii TaxID=1917878 RepID=UPI00192A1D96|nr:hypothetical protein [Prevotella ihumii]
MDNQVAMWSLVMMVMVAMFIIRSAVNARRGHGNHKLFEMGDEFSMYDLGEDEL